MSSHVDKIENRMGRLKQDREKKIEVLCSSFKPTFTPRINKNTDKLLEDNKKRVHSNSPLTLMRQSQSIKDFSVPVRE